MIIFICIRDCSHVTSAFIITKTDGTYKCFCFYMDKCRRGGGRRGGGLKILKKADVIYEQSLSGFYLNDFPLHNLKYFQKFLRILGIFKNF